MRQMERARLCGEVLPPGDKSIAHRAALLASVAHGTSTIERFPHGDDCQRTLELIETIGADVERLENGVRVSGRGYFHFRGTSATLDAGNSGSTMRMACGLLAPQPFDSRLSGDESLRRRPMDRVIQPLSLMGARIESVDGCAPLTIRGGRRLRGIDYRLPVASAQVKTSILLAGLHADGDTTIHEPSRTRNHTELALAEFGATLHSEDHQIRLTGRQPLYAVNFRLPGDISSAAFFIVGAAILPGSDLRVRDVGLNPTRTAFLDVLRSMGARIDIEDLRTAHGEIVGSVRVRGSDLVGVEVAPERAPFLIDEVPALAVAAAYARGETFIRGVSELRIKESDRLHTLALGLRSLAVEVDELEDGIRIRGGRRLQPAALSSSGDHRIAMAWGIAALGLDRPCEIEGRVSASVSYPEFWGTLEELVR